MELTTQKCKQPMGTKPWWMGVDQYDPCPCVLPSNHTEDHECKHGVKEGNYGLTSSPESRA